MRYIADLHLHSKYSRACSKDLDLEHNSATARQKGIQLLGTGDFTHPAWFAELQSKLEETKPGIFTIRGDDHSVDFMLTTEISCIYKQGEKVRRIHICLFAPSFVAVQKIIVALEARGVNLKSDGRPIMGLRADEIVDIVLSADARCMVVPAHIWTPWFSIFGSKSGFDSMDECFGAMTKHIAVVETGLSSDPPMNWQWSHLDRYTLISNSDAHSPANLGREANVFEVDDKEISYDEICRIMSSGDRKKFLHTIEFFPEEGKYHHDGHRACGISFTPDQSTRHGNRCPICKKPLVIGVLNRVLSLADRAAPKAEGRILYMCVVPLIEIIAEALGQGKNTKAVRALYAEMLAGGGTEFSILIDQKYEEIKRYAPPEVVAAITNVREGNVRPIAGYDGEYGVIKTLGDMAGVLQKQQPLF